MPNRSEFDLSIVRVVIEIRQRALDIYDKNNLVQMIPIFMN